MSNGSSSAPDKTGGAAFVLNATEVLRLGQRLPSSPQVFNRISRLSSDPNSNLPEIAKLVKLDAALALRVLQVSNGAYYGFSEPCGTLDEAINRLGFREIHRLVGVVASQHLFSGELALHRVSGRLVWTNSIACALAMEWLTGQQNRDEAAAYAIGLLRPVGLVVLDRLLIERPTLSCFYPGEESEPVVHRWERRMFGMSAAEVAAVLMEHWQFPAHMAEAMRHHLDPVHSPDLPVEACLLNFAGGIAASLGAALPGEKECWQPHPLKFKRTGLTEAALEECARHTRHELERIQSAVADKEPRGGGARNGMPAHGSSRSGSR
jgi:HD-like signal output (HDOD) protein